MNAALELSVTFRIFRPNADLSDLGPKLGWAPLAIWKVGQSRKTPIGRLLPGKYKSSYCAFEFVPAPRLELSAVLGRILSILESNKAHLLDVTSTGGKLELVIGIYVLRASSFKIDSTIIKRCGELNIGFGFLPGPFKMPNYNIDRGTRLKTQRAGRK